MTERTFTGADGKSTVRWYAWEPEGQPVAVLQIIHGMSEYMGRYEAFAKYLNGFGILVVGNDHIGHGGSADPADYGYFGPRDGWLYFVKDAETVHQTVMAENPGIPYFIMGHSMGSFVARTWFATFGQGVDGIIFMGTAGANPAIGAGMAMVKLLRGIKGERAKSKLITGMAFGAYNKRIKDAKTTYDWLTRDGEIVAKYNADPACGFEFTLAGYEDLFSLLKFINAESWYKAVPKDIPVLIVAGGDDPVGAYGNGPAEVCEKLQAAGCEDVSLIIYEGMRHEILNEYGKETVMEDVRRFVLGEEAEGAEEEPAEETGDAE